MMHRAAPLVIALGLLATTAGCLTPVPAWKRGDLAHKTMTADEMSNGLDGHVRAVSEGATGGLAGGGGGCGCN
jgi:hypothetical protein